MITVVAFIVAAIDSSQSSESDNNNNSINYFVNTTNVSQSDGYEANKIHQQSTDTKQTNTVLNKLSISPNVTTHKPTSKPTGAPVTKTTTATPTTAPTTAASTTATPTTSKPTVEKKSTTTTKPTVVTVTLKQTAEIAPTEEVEVPQTEKAQTNKQLAMTPSSEKTTIQAIDSEKVSKLSKLNVDWSYDTQSDTTQDLQTIVNLDNGKFIHTVKNPAVFHVKYPKDYLNSTQVSKTSHSAFKYENNAFHRWCHVFSLDKSNDNNNRKIEITIIFNVFSIERGFDRLKIRLFNQSMLKPPIVISGRGFYNIFNKQSNIQNKQWRVPQNLTFYLHSNETLGVCLELETDESNVCRQENIRTNNKTPNTTQDQSSSSNIFLSNNDCAMYGALDVDIIARYDNCLWQDWSECHVESPLGHYNSRGPFWDGDCGIGVQQRVRATTKTLLESSAAKSKAQTCSVGIGTNNSATSTFSFDTGIEGPNYCIKAPCGNADQTHNSKIPGKVRGTQNKPFSNWWNGHGRIDPDSPHLFDLLYQTDMKDININCNIGNELSQPIYTIQDRLDAMKSCVNKDSKLTNLQASLKKLTSNLKKELSIIVSQYPKEDLLKIGILKHKFFDQSQKYLGARLTHSLVIGRPFIIAFTGSSNTAGHDNMFESTYPIQLNSRLRPIWAKHGNVGASFNSRNVAIGGDPKTLHFGFISHVQSSETPTNFYHEYSNIMHANANANDVNNNSIQMNNMIDVIFWESMMNDGGNPTPQHTELFLRNVAATNAIFAATGTVSACADKQEPTPWKTLWEKHPTSVWSRSHTFTKRLVCFSYCISTFNLYEMYFQLCF